MDKVAFQKHLGLKVRERRQVMGMTLIALSADSGIGFQQIQKYEAGAVAISAAVLWKLACSLEVPVSYFYEGLGRYRPPFTEN